MATEAGQEVGDVNTMFAAVDQVATDYEIDAVKVKTRRLGKLLERVAQSASAAAELKERTMMRGRVRTLLKACKSLADEAIAQADYDSAQTVVQLALAPPTCPTFLPTWSVTRKNLSDAVNVSIEKWENVKKALATLQVNPDNDGANLVAGSWYCFQRADLAKGLPYLAKSNEESLRAPAGLEQDPPRAAGEQSRLAGLWWKASESTVPGAKDLAFFCAAYWYAKVEESQAEELSERAELRLGQIENRLAQVASPWRPGAQGAGKPFFIQAGARSKSVGFDDRR